MGDLRGRLFQAVGIAGAKALRQNMQGGQHGRNRVGERESGGDVFRK